jgi:hypothetical protein
LVAQNARRGRLDWEFELLDTDAFAEDRYFDVFVEYAKAGTDDIAVRITAYNRGPEGAPLVLLPSLWFRNTWAWRGAEEQVVKPAMWAADEQPHGMRLVISQHPRLGTYHLYCQASGRDGDGGTPQLLFTDNETNFERVYGAPNGGRYVKDGINDAVVNGDAAAVNPDAAGTKAASVYRCSEVPAGGSVTLRLRLKRADGSRADTTEADVFGRRFDELFDTRVKEADAFYKRFAPECGCSADAESVQRQAYAGLVWTKQFYHFDVDRWLSGDPGQPPPPPERRQGRNGEWKHVSTADILSMPDKWEYPWFAAWDTAFHMLPFAQIDPDFAKHQLLLLCREWYMHPNGQIPAYEWAFGDVNPPVHAWAALRIYKIERKMQGKGRHEPGDVDFLERIFHKLLLNFTWWVNRKDRTGNNVFEAGSSGSTTSGSSTVPRRSRRAGFIEQADGTAWMAMYSLNLLAIALELCRVDRTYEDVATKFAEHFIYIAHALNHIGEEDGVPLWDEEDGFYYDVLHLPDDTPDGRSMRLKTRSIAGLIPLFAVEAFDGETLAGVPISGSAWSGSRPTSRTCVRTSPTSRGAASTSARSSRWWARIGSAGCCSGSSTRRSSSARTASAAFPAPRGAPVPTRHRREALPGRLSARRVRQRDVRRQLELARPRLVPPELPPDRGAAEVRLRVWRGLPDRGADRVRQLHGPWGVATELSRRLTRLFLRDDQGRRPVYGGVERLQKDPHWRDHVLFYEYFHGDNGAGPRRQPPDRLDGTRGEADRAER